MPQSAPEPSDHGGKKTTRTKVLVVGSCRKAPARLRAA
jgi:hypothetical protein